MTVEAYLNGVSQAHDMFENEIDNLLMNGWDILEQCNENGSNELFFVDKFGPLSEDFGNGVISEGLLLQHFEESCIKPFVELSNYLGIFKPLYSFGVKNFFGLKINPLNLNLINILHYGAPKIWYIINNDPQNLNKFYGIVGSSVNEFFICSPHILDHHKIGYAVIIQRAGDAVFLRGGYPFFGFHCGVNFSSEIFYATPEWVKENLGMISKGILKLKSLVSKQPGKMYKIKGELGQPLFSVAGDEDSIRLAQVFNQWKIDYEQKNPGAIIKFNQLKKMIGKIEKNDTQAYNHLRKPIIKKVATPRKYTPKQKSQKATRRKKLREELRTLGFLTNVGFTFYYNEVLM
uniref:JmjC domain-containing protein n=1 Tax=Acrobeloides nanus TaxID=290746 RepID=A0A914EHD5_9BILA